MVTIEMHLVPALSAIYRRDARDPRSRNSSRFGSKKYEHTIGEFHIDVSCENRYAPKGTYMNTMHDQGQDNYVYFA